MSKHVLQILRHAAETADRKAWEAAEDAFMEPTDTELKARVRALSAKADEAWKHHAEAELQAA